MPIRYSDLHLQILTRGLLDPGEHLTGHVMAERNPWYGFGLLRKQYLLVSTDRRLLVLEHKRAWLHRTFVLSKVESLPWNDVEELALRGLVVKTKIRLVARTMRGVQKLHLKMPTWLAPIRDNARAGKAVVATFQAQRALGPASTPRYAALT
jgi:hypothetical protein